jgi:hypothetical protein
VDRCTAARLALAAALQEPVELWILALEALQLALVAASLLKDFAECVSLVRCA